MSALYNFDDDDNESLLKELGLNPIHEEMTPLKIFTENNSPVKHQKSFHLEDDYSLNEKDAPLFERTLSEIKNHLTSNSNNNVVRPIFNISLKPMATQLLDELEGANSALLRETENFLPQ